ncbi:hypothetical protein R6Q59_002748 [Mikania micrantha]
MPRIIPVASWIDEAICRNIRELDIELDNINFPDCFFTCGTLVKLKLRFVRFVTDELDQILIDLPNLISFDTSSQQTVAPSLPFVAPTVMVIKVNSLEFVKTTVYGLEIVFHVLENSSSLSSCREMFGQVLGGNNVCGGSGGGRNDGGGNGARGGKDADGGGISADLEKDEGATCGENERKASNEN